MSNHPETELTPQELDRQIQKLKIEKSVLLQNSLFSQDAEKILKAQLYLQEGEKSKSNPKAYFFPFDAEYHSGRDYKNPIQSIPDHILRRVSYVHIINSIINTKINQVLDYLKFTTDEQKEGYTIRKKLSRFQDRQKEKEISKQEQKTIESLVDFLEAGGQNTKWDLHDELIGFIGKVLRDSFTFNRSTFELERNMKNELIKFHAIDAQTVRFLETVDPFYKFNNPNSKYAEKEYQGKKYLPRYCQIWNSQIAENPITKEQITWYPWEMAFETRNKSTDIWRNGYGVSEIEILGQIITWVLNGLQYNGNFFSQGSNPKGLLNVKNGDGGGQQIMNSLRQMWSNSIAGVDNAHRMPVVEGLDLEFIDMQHCLHRDTEVITKSGNISLDALLNSEREIYTQLWDGERFSEARVFTTKKKKVYSLELSNRLEIKSSPNHRFLVLRNDKPEWVERRDIGLGDYIFVNKKEVSSSQELLKYNNISVEDDLFELLGWMTGDGHIGDNENSKRMMKLFYHPEREQDVLYRHLDICKKYGINAKIYTSCITERELERLQNKTTIKSVILEKKYIAIVDSNFFNWYISLGFTTSKQKKIIPSFLYSYDSPSKCGFLRGFFSADGHVSKNGSHLNITISNKNLKRQTISLLMSEGIRCTSFKLKKTKCGFGTCSEDCVLLVKDRDVFFDKISFIQERKRSRETKRQKSTYKTNEAPISFRQSLALKIKEFNKTLSRDLRLSKKFLGDLLNISRGYQKASLSKVISYAEMVGYEIPSFLRDYNLEVVTKLIETDEAVEMVDVEMNNSTHQFCANGIIVHNSNKDMEFQLWNEFLIVLTCSVFVIDPSELGFHFKTQSEPFGQKGEKQRLDHSKDKGLKPILVFTEKLINKYIISELDENYEFKFTGVDLEDESAYLDNDVKKVANGFVSMEDMFEKYSHRKFNEKGDTILNSVYQQSKQAAMYGGQGMNEMVDEEPGGDSEEGAQNPFSQFSKAQENNPIWEEAQRWLKEKQLID